MNRPHPASPHRSRPMLLGVMAAVAASALVAPFVHAIDATPAHQARFVQASPGHAVPGAYIVTTRKGNGTRSAEETRTIALSAVERAEKMGATIRHRYEYTGGYAANFTPQQLAQVRQDPDVDIVEEVSQRTLFEMLGTDPADTPVANGFTRTRGSQSRATWGIDRVDQRSLPLDRTYNYQATGKNVNVYIMDTGIYTRHNEFRGRIKGGGGWSKVNGRQEDSMEDCHGHGTHVAGTAAGTTYGLAKDANLYALRIFNCEADNKDDDTMAAMNWMLQNGQAPGVVNMSFGDDKKGENAFERAVRDLVRKGISIAVAAGNDGKDACRFSPAFISEVVTVGNSTKRDSLAPTSNHGRCVDISAPGTNIVSARHGSTSGTSTKTGTSMASPHVCGGIALYLESNPSASPADVERAIVAAGSTGKISRIPRGTPNVLLYTADFPAGNGQPAPPAPTQPAPAPSQPGWPPRPTQPAPNPTRPPWPPRPTQPAPPRPTQPPRPTRPRPTWPNPPGWPGRP